VSPTVLAGLAGVLQGARHALEPDHVTAVATVMVEAPSPRRGIAYATFWGLGHASMLVLVAGPLLLLGLHVPERIAIGLELVVGAMLVYLGTRSFRPAVARAPGNASARPFAIGIVHGLAGSGALVGMLALAAPSVGAGLTCLSLYAFGTIVGMVALAAMASPLFAGASRLPQLARVLVRGTGALSIAMGVVWIGATLMSLRG
jgi:hypothetical protein